MVCDVGHIMDFGVGMDGPLRGRTDLFGVSNYGGNMPYLAWADKGLGKPGWKGDERVLRQLRVPYILLLVQIRQHVCVSELNDLVRYQ